jgi:vesicle coat complex subunit
MEDIRSGTDLIRRLPVYERAARDISAYVPWSCDQDSFEKEIGVVRKIVEACGKRHNKVTCTQMDDLDVRLSCDLCSQNGRMVVVTWRSAVSSIFLSLLVSGISSHLRSIMPWNLTVMEPQSAGAYWM